MSTKIYNQSNIMQLVYDEANEALKVNLVGSGSPTLPNVVRLSDGTDYLTSTVVGADRALDVNIVNDIALTINHVDDSIRLGDGTVLFTSTTIGLKSALDVNLINVGLATEAKQDTANSSLSSIDTKLDGPLNINTTGLSTEAKQDAANTLLTSIDSKLTSPIVVSGTISVGDLNASKDDVAIAGTEDGTATGTVRHFVNNQRLQILAAHDREMDITYADFGTKNERITYIIYTSATFPGISAIKTINYTLVSGKYRRDSINWSIV